MREKTWLHLPVDDVHWVIFCAGTHGTARAKAYCQEKLTRELELSMLRPPPFPEPIFSAQISHVTGGGEMIFPQASFCCHKVWPWAQSSPQWRSAITGKRNTVFFFVASVQSYMGEWRTHLPWKRVWVGCAQRNIWTRNSFVQSK